METTFTSSTPHVVDNATCLQGQEVHCQLCSDPETTAFAVGNYMPEAPHEVRVVASPPLLGFRQLTKWTEALRVTPLEDAVPDVRWLLDTRSMLNTALPSHDHPENPKA